MIVRTLTYKTVAALLAMFAASTVAAAQSQVPEPEVITVMRLGPPEFATGCGLRLDYNLADTPMRVEITSIPVSGKANISLKAYNPTGVSLLLRNIWLTTETHGTMRLLRPAMQNTIGILEAKGTVEPDASTKLFQELLESGARVTVLVDGSLPASQRALSVPGPLSADVRDAFATCTTELAKRAAAGP